MLQVCERVVVQFCSEMLSSYEIECCSPEDLVSRVQRVGTLGRVAPVESIQKPGDGQNNRIIPRRNMSPLGYSSPYVRGLHFS